VQTNLIDTPHTVWPIVDKEENKEKNIYESLEERNATFSAKKHLGNIGSYG
jgi:hypothetical protein